jgi:protein subunit release factor B
VAFRIDEKDLRESFARGSGPGGQKINKTRNNVLLVHEPTGILVQCQDARDLTTNRKIARKLLRDKVDLSINGAESKLGKKYEKIRKRKKNAAR